jgi:hypothetical protein
MRGLIRATLSLVGLAVVMYVWFFVPLGQRTLHEHAMRIASTEPARELGEEAADATGRVVEHVQGEWQTRYSVDGGAPDASAPGAGVGSR